MRKRLSITCFAAALVLFAWGATAGADTEKLIENLKYPEIGEIKVPEPERVELENGMVVYLLEDHEFPIVDIFVRMRAGGIYEPSDKIGLAQLTGEVMRSGGSENYPGDDLDLSLENMGARLSIGFGDESGTASLSTLSDDIDSGVEILVDVLRNPAFPEEKIELGKVEMRTDVASRNDEPLSILSREFQKMIFGADSPYGRHTEYATIEAITRDDLVEFQKTYVRPDQMIATVYGDFDTAEMKSKLAQTFGAWPAGTGPLPPDPGLPEPKAPTVHYAHKAGTTNSSIGFGHLGMLASEPDYAAVIVMNKVLGSGFKSRLFSEIRSRRGLAYAVGSGAGTGFHHPGAFRAHVETRIDSTVATIRAVQEEIRKIREEGITEEELAFAKESILNGLIFDFSSKGSVLNRMAFYEFNGYPVDFLQQYQEAVRNVTLADVKAAAQKHLRPEEMQILVVGNEEEFDEPLAALGLPVNEIDITIPEPPAKLEVPEATAESLAEGQRLLLAAATAMGGKAKLAGVKTVHAAYEGSMQQMGQSMSISGEIWKVFPDKQHMTIKLPFGEMAQVLSDGAAWMEGPMGTQALPPAMVDEMMQGMIRDPYALLGKADTFKAQRLEQTEMEGVLCDPVFIHHDAVKEWVIYLDAETSMPVRMDYRSIGQSGPVSESSVYGDWKTVNGVKAAGSLEVRHDGEKAFGVKFTTVELNTEPDATLFQKPSDVGDANPGG